MRIALYVRVSTEEQESSIVNQKNYIKSLYPKDEIIIYQDFGISGTKITGRDGFIQMLKDAGLKQHFITKNKFVFLADETKEPLFDKIVTKSVTRFARNTDVLTIWKELEQKGIHVHFTDINKDTSSKTDSLILNLSLTLAQEESANISERTKFGNKATAKANKIRGNGLYGYNFIKETNSLRIKKIAEKKMKELEVKIEKNENSILEFERLKTNIENDKLELESKIVNIKNELKVVESTELTREQLMERIKYIKVNKNNDLVVEYH